jgi:hypothetical protein
VGVRVRLSRNASIDRPFWVSFDGRRRRKRAGHPAARALTPAKRQALERQKPAEKAEWQRIATMTPEEYARHIGLSEDQVARVRRIAELRGPSPQRTCSRPRCDGLRARRTSTAATTPAPDPAPFMPVAAGSGAGPPKAAYGH